MPEGGKGGVLRSESHFGRASAKLQAQTSSRKSLPLLNYALHSHPGPCPDPKSSFVLFRLNYG